LQIGGLRTDPFKMYPIENDGQVAAAFDYCRITWRGDCSCIAATNLLTDIVEYAPRAVKTAAPYDEFFHFYVQTILHDAMLFEAMVTFCMALQVLHRGKKVDKRLSSAAVQHSVETMRKLRERLLGPEGTSDVVINTIVLIAFATLWLGELHAFNVHITALSRIIALRGGEDALGYNGYIKSRWKFVEAKWEGLQLSRLPLTQCSISRPDASEALVYPTHPYSSELCAQIVSLPSGIADVCMTGELSERFMSMLTLWHNSPLHEARLGSLDHLPPEAEVFLGSMPSWTVSELLIATTIGAYSLCFTNGTGNTIPQLHVQAQVQQLADDVDGLARCNENVVLWALLTIRAATERTTSSWRWANNSLSVVTVTEEKLREFRDAFVPSPNLCLLDKSYSIRTAA